MRMGALLLAAGAGQRMGGPKPALPLGGVPLVVRAYQSLGEAGLPTIVVTGAHAAAVRTCLPDVPHVHALAHEEGLSASLRAGLLAVPAGWRAVLVALADMPAIAPATHAAVACALAAGALVARPVHAGRPGHPVGFGRALFPSFAALRGDRGARALLARLPVVEVPVDDAGIHLDLDTPQDLTAAEARLSTGGPR